MTDLRPELPPLPQKMRHLPIDARGYPVPWFVAWLDKKGRPLARGRGTPEFRVQAPNAAPEAHNAHKCWVCGGKLGKYLAFTTGSIAAVNRSSGEPPSHLECSDWAARACPFLSRPHARRRSAGMPEGTGDGQSQPGEPILRNPGVALVYVTTGYRVLHLEDGEALFAMFPPTEVRWYAEGRPATREEVIESLRTGLPALQAAASSSAIEIAALANHIKAAMKLVPHGR